MLIQGAEIWGQGIADVRLDGTRITAIGTLLPGPDERVINAGGAALLPGLHDHHIHLASLAVRAGSVICGPPEVVSPDDLAANLGRPGTGWIRGIGYHESVMGLPSAKELDQLVPDRPLRMQHRSGRLWFLNSLALAKLLSGTAAPPGLDLTTGQLFDEDQWLQSALASEPPDFSEVSAHLSSQGVTGVTDMSPSNEHRAATHFTQQATSGRLVQHHRLAGTLALADAPAGHWTLGPAKLHLHEAAFPPFETATSFITAAHGQGREVAIHCVSEIELVFALALLEEAGASPGDRIEHASVTPPELIPRIAELGLAVCVQPQFVAERGDRYLADIEMRYHSDLYRLRSLIDAGIPLAGGSDAPFASADPWAAMTAAVFRQTREGQTIGLDEALTPEQALSLYLAEPANLSSQRRIAPGEPADLCLLNCSWIQARRSLTAEAVTMTIISGQIVYDRVNQAPT